MAQPGPSCTNVHQVRNLIAIVTHDELLPHQCTPSHPHSALCVIIKSSLVVSCETSLCACKVFSHTNTCCTTVTTTSRRLELVARNTFHVAPSRRWTLKESCRESFRAVHGVSKAVDDGQTFTNRACGGGMSINYVCNNMGVELDRNDITLPSIATILLGTCQPLPSFQKHVYRRRSSIWRYNTY